MIFLISGVVLAVLCVSTLVEYGIVVNQQVPSWQIRDHRRVATIILAFAVILGAGSTYCIYRGLVG